MKIPPFGVGVFLKVTRVSFQVMRSGRESLTPRAESFELFGFDVMVDEAPRKTTERRLTSSDLGGIGCVWE